MSTILSRGNSHTGGETTFMPMLSSLLYANKLDSPTPLFFLILSPNNQGISLTWLLDRTNHYSKTTTLLMVLFKNIFFFFINIKPVPPAHFSSIIKFYY